MTHRRTRRWRAASAAALFVAAVGVAVGDAGVLLAAAVPAAYAAYPTLVQPPAPTLSVRRTVDTATPGPGETVGVSLRVRNDGAETLAAVEVADDLPATLGLEDGSPRLVSPLRPDESVTVEYTVTAHHGVHTWSAPSVTLRDRSRGHEATVEPAVAGDRAVACRPSLPDWFEAGGAARPGAGAATGRGAGGEFGRVREYRRGDAPGRVDWAQFAKTGDLRTVVSPVARAGDVVVCVDARAAAFVARTGDEPNAVAHGATAARAVAASAANRSGRVGAAVFGTRFEWAPPAGGRFERTRAAAVLDDDASHWQPPDDRTGIPESDWRAALTARLSDGASVVLATPLVDGEVAAFARRLAASRRVVVVAPDTTRGDSPGARAARLERRRRVQRLRAAGVAVVDWRPPESLAAAVERAENSGVSP